MTGLFARCHMCAEYVPDPNGSGMAGSHRCKPDDFRQGAATLFESVALALAASDDNDDRPAFVLNPYDALGYQRLARAAIFELERLGVLPPGRPGEPT